MERVVGRIGKPHGIRGEVTVQVHTDAPEQRFADGAQLETQPAERGPLRVASTRWHSGRLLVQFAGVPDVAAAERLRGTMLVISTAELPPLDDPDEFYDHQLEGLRAVTVDGAPLGVVVEVIHAPGGDMLAIDRPATDRPGVDRPQQAQLLVPFVATMVPTVDLAAGQVTVDPPPGLLEL